MQLFIKGNVFIAEWEIFGAEVFICYSQFFIKGNFIIGRVECTKSCQSVPHWEKYTLLNSLCLWTGMKITKKKKEKTRMKKNTKISPNQPQILTGYCLYSSAPQSSIKQFSKRSSVTLEKEEHKCDTLTMLLGHESQETIEDID